MNESKYSATVEAVRRAHAKAIQAEAAALAKYKEAQAVTQALTDALWDAEAVEDKERERRKAEKEMPL